MNTSNNKTIAKNAVMLYLRMFLTIIVGLYTSRVVLATLGVEDYGIYGVVGGVVSMMGFLNASMSAATSRFLTFELGTGDAERMSKTFSSALVVHIGIALIVLLLAETIGLWFLCNKLVIPDGRMQAAHWVFQLSILSAMLSITQVPYNSCIIAHEKMDVYAYVEIVNVTLKLLVVYLLQIGHSDRLILYAILMFGVSVVVLMMNRIYCLRHFEESRFRWVFDKAYLKPMLAFSGWDLFGNMSVTMRQQGTNFLVNMFFGVAFNAASGIASTVNGVLSGFCHNVLTAFRPQIIKLYSEGRPQQSIDLLYNAGKFSTLLFALIAIPFCLEMQSIMDLWLGTPPDFAVMFCQIMVMASCINMCECSVNIGITATAQMREMSVYTGLCYLGVLPLIYAGYRMGFPVEIAYYLSILVCSTNLIIRCSILKKKVPQFSYRRFALEVLVPVILICVITGAPAILLHYLISDRYVRFFMVFATALSLGAISTYSVALTAGQREKVRNVLARKMKTFRK